MKPLLNFLQKKWVLELIAVLVLCLLIVFIGPLIAIAGDVLLESWISRLLAVAVVFGVWLTYRLVNYWLLKKKERSLFADLSAGQGEGGAVSEELLTLKRKFEDALKLLEATPGRKRGGGHFLYQLPWYVIIGAPGAGKTTALLNSGLNFPLKDQLGAKIQGVSGTRNCDWWFSDQAVLLDTAGRYSTQDSDREADAGAWHGFLQLLKKHRPRRPLNGIFLAVSITDVLQQSEEKLAEFARVMRMRIKELNGQLGVNLPVYVLFTKMDMLSGFNEFFADLTETERQQVWGKTFAWSDKASPAELAEHFSQDYTALVERLNVRRFKRLQDERDAQRRALIFDFSQQLTLLKPDILCFIKETFATNIYETPFIFRGVYFTSGTQEGTPFDKIMSALTESFDLRDRQALSPIAVKGKSYFLTKLLRDVVIPEGELVGVNQAAERRHQLVKLGSYISVALLVVLGAAGWTFSFTGNKMAISEIEQQVEKFKANRLVASDIRNDLLTLSAKMDALLAARNVYRESPMFTGLGLSQQDKLENGARIAYERVLRESFAPLLSWRLKERMQGAEGQQLDNLYQLLTVYLMLSEPARMDKKVAAPWIGADWQSLFLTDPAVQASLQTHLVNLLDLSLDPLPADYNFVNAARVKLTQIPQAAQVYSVFKSEGLYDHEHDLVLAKALAPNGERVYVTKNGASLQTLVVPGLFTGYGFTEIFLKKGMDYVKQANEQNWVLGVDGKDTDVNTDRLYSDLKRLYLADYQKIWLDDVLALNLKPQANNNQLIDTLDVLSRPDSPLKLLLQTVEKNTALSKLSADAAAALTKTGETALAAAAPKAMQKFLPKPALNVTGQDPIVQFEEAFEPYNSQVRSPEALNRSLESIKNAHDRLLMASGQNNSGAGLDALLALQSEASALPDKVAAPLKKVVREARAGSLGDAKQELNKALAVEVSQPCRNLLAGRYPFAPGASQDVLLADFGKVFGGNGILDQYFNNHLKILVDTTTKTWSEMNSEKSLGLSSAALAQFQIAAHIRNAFFAGGGVPQLQFDLKPIELDDRIGTFRLNIEGQELVYRHGPEQITSFKWPGVAVNAGVRVVFETLDGKQVSRQKEGAWALFRMLDQFHIEPTNLPERFILTVTVDDYKARFELRAASVDNPFKMTDFQNFHCPDAL